mmetsp:Transcript_32705/g.37084  ORF Transcript_32705/g.37084 Transcript_32705/m.37084 type:complete len:246 (+) Transcript_32705:1-738(+)
MPPDSLQQNFEISRNVSELIQRESSSNTAESEKDPSKLEATGEVNDTADTTISKDTSAISSSGETSKQEVASPTETVKKEGETADSTDVIMKEEQDKQVKGESSTKVEEEEEKKELTNQEEKTQNTDIHDVDPNESHSTALELKCLDSLTGSFKGQFDYEFSKVKDNIELKIVNFDFSNDRFMVFGTKGSGHNEFGTFNVVGKVCLNLNLCRNPEEGNEILHIQEALLGTAKEIEVGKCFLKKLF